MKKKLFKTLSAVIIGLNLISIKASAGTWEQHQWCPPDTEYLGSWGYINDDGSYAQPGWNYIDGEWYYFGGELNETLDGLQTIDGKDYYLDYSSKAMTHDKYVKIGGGRYGAWYWTNSDGSIDYNNVWYPESLYNK